MLILALLLFWVGCQKNSTDSEMVLYDQWALRRLSPTQYNNTIQDVFEGYDVPLFSFPTAEYADFYDNNTDLNEVTPVLVEAFHRSSLELVLRLDQQGYFPQCSDSDCVLVFLLQQAEILWRRPLKVEEQLDLISVFEGWIASEGVDLTLAMGLQHILLAPDFLYFPEYGYSNQGKRRLLNGHEMASRLSYFLWNTAPDSELLELAALDQLRTKEDIEIQAWRMLNHKKAEHGILHFFKQWLAWDKIGSNLVDFNLVHIFDGQENEPELVSDYLHQVIQPHMRLEPEVFVVQHMLKGAGTLSHLLSSRTSFVTPVLADLYGVEIQQGADSVYWETDLPAMGSTDDFDGFSYGDVFYEAELPDRERSGLLTMLGMLHVGSGPAFPSPVLRGVFVLEQFLCFKPAPPPEDVPALTTPEQEQALTNRERYEQHSINTACSGCHRTIDGVGFAFEHYDVLGRYRTYENGQPIDSSGELLISDVQGSVSDAVHLAEKLASSRQVHDCFVEHWLAYALARKEWRAQDKVALKQLQQGFWKSEGDILGFLVDVVASPSFRYIGAE